jgi:hydrogenase-4 component F
VTAAAGEGEFAQRIMVFMGLLSMGTAAIFMIRQGDFKKLLAYSSVEHMGILVLGVGIGGTTGILASLLHVINNAMTKGVLFLSAGNIHRAYGSRLARDVQGALRSLPLSGSLFLAGFLAGCGSPPFAPFVSEFSVLTAALASGRYLVAALFLLAMLAVFIGMGLTVTEVVFGKPSHRSEVPFPDGFSTGAPIVGFMAIVLLLGVYIPEPLVKLLDEAVAFLQLRP